MWSPPPTCPQFEKLQPMKLVVYDVDTREKDNRKLKLGEQDFLGGWRPRLGRSQAPTAALLGG